MDGPVFWTKEKSHRRRLQRFLAQNRILVLLPMLFCLEEYARGNRALGYVAGALIGVYDWLIPKRKDIF